MRPDPCLTLASIVLAAKQPGFAPAIGKSTPMESWTVSASTGFFMSAYMAGGGRKPTPLPRVLSDPRHTVTPNDLRFNVAQLPAVGPLGSTPTGFHRDAAVAMPLSLA